MSKISLIASYLIFAILLIFLMLNYEGFPGVSSEHPLGFFGWYDQGQYLKQLKDLMSNGVTALSSGIYPPGYMILAIPFTIFSQFFTDNYFQYSLIVLNTILVISSVIIFSHTLGKNKAIFFLLLLSFLIGIYLGNANYNSAPNEQYQFLFRAWSLDNTFIFFSLFIIGVCGFIAFLCIFEAYRIGSPPSVAPFEYILIVWSLILSWIIWKETLNFKGYIGLFCIVFGGFYTLIRERKKHIQITTNKPFRR